MNNLIRELEQRADQREMDEYNDSPGAVARWTNMERAFADKVNAEGYQCPSIRGYTSMRLVIEKLKAGELQKL